MAMKKASLADMQKETGRDAHTRATGEDAAQDGVLPDGRIRRRTGRVHQILWRATAERKAQLDRLAGRLSIGQLQPVSYTITMERALDALERELQRKGKVE
jgi:hypothetical protein